MAPRFVASDGCALDVAGAAFVGLLKLAARAQPAGVVVVIDLTTAKLPRRPCADPLCSVSSMLTSTFAAAG
jgi:hypothetical protein